MSVGQDQGWIEVRRARLEEVGDLGRGCHAEQLATYGRVIEPALPPGAVAFIALEGFLRGLGYRPRRLLPSLQPAEDPA